MNDSEINRMVAEKVAGSPILCAYCGHTREDHRDRVVIDHTFESIDYVNDANAVLPLLEKRGTFTVEYKLQQSAYRVQLWREFAGSGPESGCPEPPHLDIEYDAEAETFPRAACLALLKAHGVEVPLE